MLIEIVVLYCQSEETTHSHSYQFILLVIALWIFHHSFQKG